MTKRRIAVIVSLLFAAPAAVIAQLESSEPATEVSVVTVEPAVVVTGETIVIDDQPAVIVAEQPAVAVTEMTVIADYQAPRSITYQTSGMNDPVFFQADVQHFQPLPAQARYLDRLERERSMQFAARPAWTFAAASAEETWMKPLAAQAASSSGVISNLFSPYASDPICGVNRAYVR